MVTALYSIVALIWQSVQDKSRLSIMDMFKYKLNSMMLKVLNKQKRYHCGYCNTNFLKSIKDPVHWLQISVITQVLTRTVGED